jgi:hypothetical protein
MKNLLFSAFAVFFMGKAMAQPTIISSTAPAAMVTHNSFVITDQANGNGSTYDYYVEYGYSPTALSYSTTPVVRDAGVSSHEEMPTNLTLGASVYWRGVYAGGTVKTGINEVKLSASTVLYLTIENLAVKNIIIGANSVTATFSMRIKSNGAANTVWFEHDETQALLNTTGFTNAGPGINVIDITMPGLPKNATYYYRANAMSGSTVLTASTIYSFSTSSVNDIAELLKKEFKIYPNPATDKVFVEGEGTLEFFDITGRKVLEEKVEKNGERDRTEIDLSALATGTYAYRWRAEKGGVEINISSKIMKLR